MASGRIDKTVFVSYRRAAVPWALAVYQHLTAHGYDVFFDYEGIGSGDFERVIAENIRARAHFVVLLTPSALERIDEPGDWLRREIETALEAKRNIVPLLLEGFDFDTPSIARHLTGTLAPIRQYNGLPVVASYFEAAMERLRTRYLNVTLAAVMHPASAVAQRTAQEQQALAAQAAPVEDRVLAAAEWFERGLDVSDPDEQIRCFDEVTRLNPRHHTAYVARGMARREKGDLDGAIADLTEAVALDPANDPAREMLSGVYALRAMSHREAGELVKAMSDISAALDLDADDELWWAKASLHLHAHEYDHGIAALTNAIALNPKAGYYVGRGFMRQLSGDLDLALADFNDALRLEPEMAEAYYRRGTVHRRRGDAVSAVADYTEAIRLGDDDAGSYYGRARAQRDLGNYALAADDFQQYLDLGGTQDPGDRLEVERAIRALREKAASRSGV